MKTCIMFLSLLLAGLTIHAQQKAGTYRDELPDIIMDAGSSLHIISPEPIRYVDISTHAVVGDLPESVVHSYDRHGNLGVVTVIGESFIAQYRLREDRMMPESALAASFNILPGDTRPLDAPVELTAPQLRSHAIGLLAQRNTRPIRREDHYGIRVSLNNIYTVGDLVLLDITYRNVTNLAYDIDEMRFKIEDRKITKATNVQSIEISPIWQLYPHGTFKRSYRNIYVLKKATFPANKVLNVELSEKQISGRTITLKIKYRDILQADTF
jgi:conjugative transposon TraN protein